MKSKMLLICGCYRSGTTIMGLMLNAHSEIIVTDELQTYRAYSNTDRNLNGFYYRLNMLLGRHSLKASGIRDNVLGENIKFFRDEVERMNNNITYDKLIELFERYSIKDFIYYGDKHPGYIFDLDNFSKNFIDFSNIRIIYLLRDPRDVIESQLRMFDVKKKPNSLYPDGLTDKEVRLHHKWCKKSIDECFNSNYYTWLDVVNEWERVKPLLLPSRFIEIYYRDLVCNLENEAIKIANFLDINKEEIVKIFNKLFKPVRHEAWKIRLPNINNQLPDSWKIAMEKYGFI